MSDDHEKLADEQEQEVADLEQQSEQLGDHIEDVKDEATGLESRTGVATPDPGIEANVERRPAPGAEGPSQPADER